MCGCMAVPAQAWVARHARLLGSLRACGFRVTCFLRGFRVSPWNLLGSLCACGFRVSCLLRGFWVTPWSLCGSLSRHPLEPSRFLVRLPGDSEPLLLLVVGGWGFRPMAGSGYDGARGWRQPEQQRTEVRVGQYILTKPSSSSVRCRAYDGPPSVGGNLICTIKPDTTIGPIEEIEDSYDFRAVLVRGFWVNIWSARRGKIIAYTLYDDAVQRWVCRGWEHRCGVHQ